MRSAAASGLVSASSCASTALSSHHDSGVQQKIKLRLCYGGRFEQTANNSYKFVGGEYFNESIPYGIRYADFMFKLSEKFRTAVSVKYHAPGEELVPDQLISVQDDADLQELIEDYLAHLARPGTPCKTFRIKVFVFMAAEEPLTPDEIMEGQHFFSGVDNQVPARLNAMRLLDGRSSFGSTLSSVGTPSTRQQDLSATDWPLNSAGQGLGLGLDEMDAAAAAGLLNEAELQEHRCAADSTYPSIREAQQRVNRLSNFITSAGSARRAAGAAAAGAGQQQLLPSAADLREDGVVLSGSGVYEEQAAAAAAAANNSMLRQISQEMDEVLQAIDAAAAQDTVAAANSMRELLELDPPPLLAVRDSVLRRQVREAPDDDGYDGEDYRDWEAAEAAGQERGSDYQSDAPASHTPYTDGDEDVTSGRQAQQRSDSMDSMVRALPTHISDFGESAPGDEEEEGQQALLIEAALGATAGAAGRSTASPAAGEQRVEAAAAGAEDGAGGALHLPSHISAFGDDLGPLPGGRAMLSGSAEPEDGFAADLAPRLSGGQLGYARPRTQDSSFSLDGGAFEGEGQGPDAAGGIAAERAGSGDSLTSLPKLQPVHRLAKPDLKIVQRIGEGAFGEVSVAKAPLYGTVAVKWLKSERFSKHFASFGREAALLADLNHPNVLRFYGVVTESAADNTVIGIMTEYIRGGSMSSFLRMSRTLLPLRVRCELALGAANGLAYLHELRIVHFDLKPDNLLLDAPPGVVRAAAESGSEELPPPKFVTSPRALTSPGDSSGRGVGAGAAAAGGAAGSNASSQQEPGGLARGGSGLGSNTSPGSATGPRAAGGGGSGTRRNSSGPGVTRTGSGLMESSELPVVKVADFGLSKHKLNSSYVSSCRDLRGTLPYMAPELVSDPERVCEKADVWSLGVVMWEMMTRETPFQDLPPQQILLGLMCGNLHLDVPEWCEPEWRFLLEACMESNPNNRPTMRELARQLEAIRDQQLQHEQELEELEAKRLQQEQQERPQQQAQAQPQAAEPQQPAQSQQAAEQQQQVQDIVLAAPTPGVLLQLSQAGRQSPTLHAPQQVQLGHSQGLPPLHSAGQQQQQQRLVQPPPQLEVQATVPHLQPLQQPPVLSPVQLPDDLLDASNGCGTGGAGAYGAVCEAYWPQHSPLAPAAVASPGHIGPIGPAHPQLQQL